MSSLLTQTKNKKMKVFPKLSKVLIPFATVVTLLVEAPGGYKVSTEEDGFLTRIFTTLSFPVGLQHTTLSDGYVVMLEPLSTGTYFLNFGNSDGDESTFVLTVNEKVPEPTSTLNLFVLGIGSIALALTNKLTHR